MRRTKFLRMSALAAAAMLVAIPQGSIAAPRMIKINKDGTFRDTSQPKWQKIGSPTPAPTPAPTQSTDSGSGDGTAQPTAPAPGGGDDPAPVQEYISTLVNGKTPSPYFWGGRDWRVNAGSFWTNNMDHSVMVSPAGKKVRLEIRNTSNDRSINDRSTKRRAELSGSIYGDPTRLRNGVSLWGAFSTKHLGWADPAGMDELAGGVYGQIHMGNTFGGSPAVAFRRRSDGTFRITTRGEFDTEGTTRYQAPLSFDQVHDVVYNLVLDPVKGSLKVWIDGSQVVNVSDVSIGSRHADSYWAMGVYFSRGITSPVVAEYANHVYPSVTSIAGRVQAPPPWPAD